MKMTTTLFTITLLALVGHLTEASATPVTWTLTGATFNDGGTMSGSFVYDADQSLCCGIMGELMSGTITTTSGSQSVGATFSVGPTFLSGSALYLYDYFANNIDQSIGIFLASVPTNGGGTIAITSAFERRDDNTHGQQNLWFVQASDTAAAGYITTSEAPSTPEPSTVVLAAGALLAVAGWRRRTTRVKSLQV